MSEKVYIAHPYADDPKGNKERADVIAQRILNSHRDVLPVSPLHLFSFLEDDGGMRDEIMETCLSLLEGCDRMWYFGTSPGVRREILFADDHGIPVQQAKLRKFGRLVVHAPKAELEAWRRENDT